MTELERLIKFRRDLHRIPELSFDLPQTIAYVRAVLEGLSCEIVEPCESCICAFFDVDAAQSSGRDISGSGTDGRGASVAQPDAGAAAQHDANGKNSFDKTREPTRRSPTTAIRADMDALPIHEESGVAFCSTTPGHMHACGHDGHMAMALAAACWVDEQLRAARAGVAISSQLIRNILFVFQPAEETTGGARLVCESGVFEHYGVDRIFGFHVWPDLPAGVVASRPGPLLARASETTLTIHGRSSHIAKASEGNDALLAGAHFLSNVEELMARLSAEEPCLLKFGHMTSGTVRNAISGESVIEGSLRVFSADMFERARAGVNACAREACERYGCTYDLHFAEGYPPVRNNEALFEAARKALDGEVGGGADRSRGTVAAETDGASAETPSPRARAGINAGAEARVAEIGGATIAEAEAAGAVSMRGDGLALIPKPLLIAEDFAFYQQHLPGVFFLLGTGTGIALHASNFRMDERVLLQGLATYKTLLQML